MISRAEILSVILINAFLIMTTLIGGLWKIKGWVDKLNATDDRLATAISGLTEALRSMHSDNQARFASMELALRARPRR